MITDNFITIKIFTYSHEAAVIVSRLESEGIECFLKDELTAQVNPFYSNAIGGIKLQVRESDKDIATEILKGEDNYEEEVNQSFQQNSLLKSKNKNTVVCPTCNSSEEVSKPQFSGRAFAISFLLLGFPIPFLSRTYHCFNCGIDFKKK